MRFDSSSILPSPLALCPQSIHPLTGRRTCVLCIVPALRVAIVNQDGYEDIIILADNFAAFNQRSLVPVKVASGSWWKYANRAVSNQIKSCILETC
ncbi:hypothetical protein AAZX31_18G109000 [Glycine max]